MRRGNRKMTPTKVAVPTLLTKDDNELEVMVYGMVYPPEKQDWNYPGAPAFFEATSARAKINGKWEDIEEEQIWEEFDTDFEKLSDMLKFEALESVDKVFDNEDM